MTNISERANEVAKSFIYDIYKDSEGGYVRYDKEEMDLGNYEYAYIDYEGYVYHDGGSFCENYGVYLCDDDGVYTDVTNFDIYEIEKIIDKAIKASC